MTEEQIDELFDIIGHMINTRASYGYTRGTTINGRIEEFKAKVTGKETNPRTLAAAYTRGYNDGKRTAYAAPPMDDEIPF